ncbi:type II secretion system protein GspM [Aggregatibacter actinomycetemcomitans]|uniref:type II secretion system protein GspM n=1 Tax=Aggregatibacter actinomycetemcomitans TaxID=714 RepID=UPI00197B1FD2|nr:type II secretion system protein GspM [Aggregatibacter actinomycetemcomitans]MBN6078700.1 type II secretion system protein M [Aggregatibacter actinomycetemcomitans]
MKFNGINGFLQHWHRLAPRQQKALLIFVGLLVLYFPTWHYWQQRSRAETASQQLQRQQEALAHQQKILATLKEKATKQLLTPELAGKLPPINQQIQQLASKLHIAHSQWDFRQKPLLKLQLYGQFTDLREFLTALFSANDELALLEWHIIKNADANDGHSIHSELLFQLHTKEK